MSSESVIAVLGYMLAATGLYGFYIGDIVLATLLFSLGGLLAKKLYISIRSIGVVTMLSAIAYGYHTAYTPTVYFIIFIGFVMACFTTRRSSRDGGEWGIDFDFSSGSGSDFGGGDGGGGD